MSEAKTYNCKHHEWDHWIHYGCKMWEGKCKLKDIYCKHPCESFEPKKERKK